MLLIALMLALCLVLEATTRLFYGRISQIKMRLEAERHAAVESRQSAERSDLLIVGNSLLLHGVTMPVLQDALPSRVTVRRFVVESTGYLDWFYGLRHLLRRGARPAAVIVVLSPRQFLSSHVEGDLFASVLMDRHDIFAVSREAGIDRTGTTNLLLDTLSAFYGSRAEIRNWVLHQALPSAEQLRQAMQPGSTDAVNDGPATQIAQRRLMRLRDLLSSFGSALVVVVPPQLVGGEGADTLGEAGRLTGVPVWIPVDPATLSPSSYSDGSHLNPQGAATFTRALADLFRRRFADPTAIGSGG